MEPENAAASSVVVLVLGVVVCAVGLIALLTYRRRAVRPAERPGDSSWEATEAKIVDFEPVPNAGTPRWRPLYAFEPAGREPIRAKAEGADYVANRSSLGQSRTAFYNPTNPRQFQVGPGPESQVALFAGVALVSIGAATVVAWVLS